MSKSEDNLVNFFAILFVLSALVGFSVVFLILDLLIGQASSEETDEPAVSLFGAPKSGWWTETYERWLWRLEYSTRADFTSSPEGLFKGSMLLAGLVGGSIGLVSSVAVAMVDIRLALPVFFVVFAPVLLVCSLSASILSQPVAGWWESIRTSPIGPEEEPIAGIFLGELVDDDEK